MSVLQPVAVLQDTWQAIVVVFVTRVRCARVCVCVIQDCWNWTIGEQLPLVCLWFPSTRVAICPLIVIVAPLLVASLEALEIWNAPSLDTDKRPEAGRVADRVAETASVQFPRFLEEHGGITLKHGRN